MKKNKFLLLVLLLFSFMFSADRAMAADSLAQSFYRVSHNLNRDSKTLNDLANDNVAGRPRVNNVHKVDEIPDEFLNTYYYRMKIKDSFVYQGSKGTNGPTSNGYINNIRKAGNLYASHQSICSNSSYTGPGVVECKIGDRNYTYAVFAGKNLSRGNAKANGEFLYNTDSNGRNYTYKGCYPNAGKYGDDVIDVEGEVIGFKKMDGTASDSSSILNYKNKSADEIGYSLMGFNKNSIGVSVVGISWIGVKWSFHKHINGKDGEDACSGPLVHVRGSTTYKDVDGAQGVAYKRYNSNGDTSVNTNIGIYILPATANASGNNKLRRSTKVTASNNDNYGYVFSGEKENASATDSAYWFTETFSGKSITRVYNFKNYYADKSSGGGGIANSAPSIFQETPGCTVNDDGTCKLIIKTKKNGREIEKTLAGRVNCETYKVGSTESYHNFKNFKCPYTISYGCTEIGKYGRCKITKYINGKETTPLVASDIDCNDGTHGRTTYRDNGKTITFAACPYKAKYNYDVDVTCENCQGTNKTGSYQVQDVANWNAILHTTVRTDYSDLQNYYKVGNYLCRYEYNVTFPNKNTMSKVVARAGRYLTVNEKSSNTQYNDNNIERLKVKITRQCINPNNKDDNFSGLTKLKGSPTNYSTVGRINLNYIETTYSRKFIGNDLPLIIDTTRTDEPNGNVGIVNIKNPRDGSTVKYKIYVENKTVFFKLNNDVYKYISKETGMSELTKPISLKNYESLPTPSLPIASSNKDKVTIQLSYTLPSNDKIYKGLVQHPNNGINYLSTATQASLPNIYKAEYLDKTFAKSACYNLYMPYKQSSYEACVNSRKRDTLTIPNNCFNSYTGRKTNGDIFGQTGISIHTCELKLTDCVTKADAIRDERSWNEDKKECCPVGTVYDSRTKKCEPPKDEHSCEPTGNTVDCYNKAGNIVKCDSQEYKDDCENNDVCDSEAFEKSLKRPVCPKYSKELDDIAHCKAPRCENGDCCLGFDNGKCICDIPTSDSTKIIYRTIDLNNPFPGQTGGDNGRDTGINWCAKGDDGTFYSCSGKANSEAAEKGNNALVYTKIINARGANGYSLYSDKEPLYSITLNAKAIKNIRKNYTASYDEWAYNENKSIGDYSSSFLKKNFDGQKVTGLCMQSNSLDKECVRE